MARASLDRLVLRPPIRVSFGLYSGLVLGSLIATVIVHLPSSEWMGPYCYPATNFETTVFFAVLGGCIGALVGVTFALLFRWLFGCWGDRNRPMTLDLQSASLSGIKNTVETGAIQPDQVPPTTDVGISRRSDVGRLPDQRS